MIRSIFPLLGILALSFPASAILTQENNSSASISGFIAFDFNGSRLTLPYSNSVAATPNSPFTANLFGITPQPPGGGDDPSRSTASQSSSADASHIQAESHVTSEAHSSPEQLLFADYVSYTEAQSRFDIVFQLTTPTPYHLTGYLERKLLGQSDPRCSLSTAGGSTLNEVLFNAGESHHQFDLVGLLNAGTYHLAAQARASSSGGRYDTDFGFAAFVLKMDFGNENTAQVGPSILTQPRARTNVVGSSLMLSVTANGTEPLTFQWYKEDVALPGATGRTCVLPNVQSTNSGNYRVRVSDSKGLTLSSNAQVTVVPVKMPDVIGGPLINPANGHQYYLLAKSTWVEAEAQAQAFGGHLATLRGATDQAWVFTNFSRWGGLEHNLWIGLHDGDPVNNATNRMDRQSEFVWSSGEPVNYSNWNLSEPNNYRDLGEFYVQTLSPSEPTGAGTWNDTWDSDVNGLPIHGVAEVEVTDVTVVYMIDKRRAEITTFAFTSTFREPELMWDLLRDDQSSNSMPLVPFGDFKFTNSIRAAVGHLGLGGLGAFGLGSATHDSILRSNGFRANLSCAAEAGKGGELSPTVQAGGGSSSASRFSISFALLDRCDSGIFGSVLTRSEPPNFFPLSSLELQNSSREVVYDVVATTPDRLAWIWESTFSWSNSIILPPGVYRLDAVALSSANSGGARSEPGTRQSASFSLTCAINPLPLTTNAVLFNNYSPTRWSPVFGPEPNNPRLFKQGNPTNGLPAGTQTYGGLPLTGTNWIVELWGLAGAGQPEMALEFQARTRIQNLTEAEKAFWGMFLAGTVELSGIPDDQPATFQVKVYDGRGGAVASWAEVLADSTVLRGWSELLTVPATKVRTLQGLQSFNVFAPANPTVAITGQPVQQIVPFSGSAMFTAIATGNPAPSYQWLFNGMALPGAIQSSLIITNVDTNNLGEYSVIARNSYSSVTSSIAMLLMSPSIRSPFLGATIIWGRSATLSASVVGSGDLSYQWFRDGEPILRGTNSTLEFSVIQITNAGLYSVVVTNDWGSATNPPAQLTVNPAHISIAMYAGVTIEGVPGFSYGIQYTTDLRDTNLWTTVTNLTLTMPVETWVDLDSAGKPRRYYRIVAQ